MESGLRRAGQVKAIGADGSLTLGPFGVAVVTDMR
jgi:hypothetical protein